MKTLKQARTKKIALMAMAILAIIATMCIGTDFETGTGVTVAMATVVAGVTLEGKEEALYLALKSSIDSEIEKHGKGYISEAKMTENINAALAKFMPNIKDSDDFKKLQTELDSVNEKLKEQGLQMKGMMEHGRPTLQKTIAEQIAEHRKANPEKWEAMKKAGAPWMEFEIKTAATMLESTHAGAGTYFPAVGIEQGFIDMTRQQADLINFVDFSSTANRVIVWVEKYNPEGNASWLGEGDVKPLVSFKYKTVSSEAKKCADKIKVSTEMLDDVDFIAAAIRNELLYLVDMAVNTALLTGAGSDEPYGITHWASAYVTTTVQTKEPNNMDAIMAVATQIRTMFFYPTHALCNPIDIANMELTKTAEGVYVIPPFATSDGKKISGLSVISTASIPVGYLLVGSEL